MNETREPKVDLKHVSPLVAEIHRLSGWVEANKHHKEIKVKPEVLLSIFKFSINATDDLLHYSQTLEKIIDESNWGDPENALQKVVDISRQGLGIKK